MTAQCIRTISGAWPRRPALNSKSPTFAHAANTPDVVMLEAGPRRRCITAWEGLTVPLSMGAAVGCLIAGVAAEVGVRGLGTLLPGATSPGHVCYHLVQTTGRVVGAVAGTLGAAVGLALALPIAVSGVVLGAAMGVGICPPLAWLQVDRAEVPAFPEVDAARADAWRAHSDGLSQNERRQVARAAWTQRIPSASTSLASAVHVQVNTPQWGAPGAELTCETPTLQTAVVDDPYHGRHIACVTRLVDLITDDHVHLDGAIVSRGPWSSDRPVVVVAVGNGERWESNALRDAVLWAARDDLQVMLYNGRGIGKSAGRETNTADEVTDARAVLTRALRDFSQVGLYGRSLGSAAMVCALAQVDAAARVSFMFCDNTFRSLPHVGAAWIGACVGGEGLARRALGWMLGVLEVDPLDVGVALATGRIAQRVEVESVTHDWVIHRQASLRHVGAHANDTRIVTRVGEGHDDFAARRDGFGTELARLFDIEVATIASVNSSRQTAFVTPKLRYERV